MTILMMVAERYDLLQKHFLLICWLTLIVMVFGLTRLRRMQLKYELTIETMSVALAVVLIFYLYNYFVLFHFPTADLFQDVHTMKGAEELGRFGILSPFVTDSYIPIKQTITGIIVRTFGFDQLIGFWAIGVWTIAFKLLVTFAASSVVTVGSRRMLVFAVASALIVNAEFSNGILCFFASLLLMTTVNSWMRRYSDTGESRSAPFPIALLVLIGIVLVCAETSTQAGFAYLLICIALTSNFGFLRISIDAAAPNIAFRVHPEPIGLLIVVLEGSMILMHRSSIILIPIAVFTGWALALQPAGRSQLALKLLGIALPTISLLPLALVLAEYLKLVDLTRIYGIMLSSFAMVLHTNASDDFALGVGLRNALIEWSRSIGALFALFLAATFFYATLTHRGRMLWKNAQFSLAWIGGWALTLIILSGAPFGYRASFYASFLFAIAASIAAPPLWRFAGKPLKTALALIFALGLIYLMTAHFAKNYAAYLGFVWPITVIAATAGLMLLSCPLIVRRLPAPVVLAVVTVLALSLDRVGTKFMLLPHSYGEPSYSPVAISHYTKEDWEIAKSLRALAPTTAVVSDPYTTSIVRALTGLNAIIGYSNLDTMNDKERTVLRNVIDGAGSGDKSKYCAAVNKLVDAGAGEYWYGIRRLLHFASDREKLDQTDTVFVFSAKTAEWASIPFDERVSYFPSQIPLRKDQIATVSDIGPVISNKDDMVIALSVSCPMARLPDD